MEYKLTRLSELAHTLREEPWNYNTNLKEKDKSFKVLFEVKSQFIQLLKTFVKEEWVNETEEENIELVDKEFTTINLLERRADIVYKIKLNKQEIYFFLLEVQSTVDKMMLLRLCEYMVELYRKYEERGKIPLVIPCVLYAGNEKWNVGNMRSLFNVRKEVEEYIPNFKYILIDVNNYTDSELIETCNLISSVFFLAKSKNDKDVVERIYKLLQTARKLNEKEQRALTRWAKMMFIKKEEVYYQISNILEEEEDNMALADLIPGAIEIWRDEGRVEGRKEGKILGFSQGKREAKISSVKRILTKKLNVEPSKKVISKIEKLTIEELESIEDRIFEIESWDEI